MSATSATEGTRRRVVTVVGGGVHVVSLLDTAAARHDLPPLELRLVARDPQRLATITRHAQLVISRQRPDWSLSATTDLDEAAVGADVVVLLVRVGGSAARAHDEQFPTACGLVGDEGLGAGGIANAWRTAPVLAGMAAQLHRAAPDALVLNLIAPLGLTTRVLLEAGLRTVGLCELPSVVLGRLAAAGADPAALSVGGLNHLSWIWPTEPDDAEAATALRRAGLAAGAVDRATLDRFGGVPMPYYYRVLQPETGRSLGIVAPPGRARQLASMSDRVLERMRSAPGQDLPELGERPTPWFELCTVPVLAAWMGGHPWTGTVNVANQGRLRGLAPDLVVEVPATVTAGEVRASAPGEPPAPIAQFLADWGRTEQLTHRAVTTRELPALDRALASLPLPLPHGAAEVLRRGVLDQQGVAA